MLKTVFLPPYDSLKLNHDANYLMTSENTVEDPLMCVQFHINNKIFFGSCYSKTTASQVWRLIIEKLMSLENCYL